MSDSSSKRGIEPGAGIPDDALPDLRMAKVRGFPWWPARPVDPAVDQGACNEERKGHTLVYFFGTRRRGWARTDNGILPLQGNLGLARSSTREGKESGKKQKLAEALAEARCSLQGGHGSRKGENEVAAALAAFDKLVSEEGFAEAIREESRGGHQGGDDWWRCEGDGNGNAHAQEEANENHHKTPLDGDLNGKRKWCESACRTDEVLEKQRTDEVLEKQAKMADALPTIHLGLNFSAAQQVAAARDAASSPSIKTARTEGEKAAGISMHRGKDCAGSRRLTGSKCKGGQVERRGTAVVGNALPHDTHVKGLAMSSCGQLLLSCTRAGVIYVWDRVGGAFLDGEGESEGPGGSGKEWRRRAKWCDTRQTNEVDEYLCLAIIARERGSGLGLEERVVIGGSVRDRYRWSYAEKDNEFLHGFIKTATLESGQILQRLCIHTAAVTRMLTAVGPLGPFCISADVGGSLVMWLVADESGGGSSARSRGASGDGVRDSISCNGKAVAGAEAARTANSSRGAVPDCDWWLEKAGDILVENLHCISLLCSPLGQGWQAPARSVATHLILAHSSGFSIVNLGHAVKSSVKAGCVDADAWAFIGEQRGGTLEVQGTFEGLYQEVCSDAASFSLSRDCVDFSWACSNSGIDGGGVGVVTCGADSRNGSVIVRVWSLLLPDDGNKESRSRWASQRIAALDGANCGQNFEGPLRLVHTLTSNFDYRSGLSKRKAEDSDDEFVPDSEDGSGAGGLSGAQADGVVRPHKYQLAMCERSVLLVGQGNIEWWDFASACRHEAFACGSFLLDSDGGSQKRENMAESADDNDEEVEEANDEDDETDVERGGESFPTAGLVTAVLVEPCIRSGGINGAGKEEGGRWEDLYLGTSAGVVECMHLFS